MDKRAAGAVLRRDDLNLRRFAANETRTRSGRGGSPHIASPTPPDQAVRAQGAPKDIRPIGPAFS